MALPLTTLTNMTDKELVRHFKDSDNPVIRELCDRLEEHIEDLREVNIEDPSLDLFDDLDN